MKDPEQIKSFRWPWLWYNGTYGSRSILGKVDMQFCSNGLSLANFLFFLKNSDSSYYNQNTIWCLFQTSFLFFFFLQKLVYPYQEHIDKSAKIRTFFFYWSKYFLINSIYISYFLRKTMLCIWIYTLGGKILCCLNDVWVTLKKL